MDESWDANKICLSAFCMRHRDWRPSFEAVKDHRKRLKQEHGLYIRKEIHAHEFVSGRGEIAPQIIPKHTRSRIFFGLLNLLAKLPVRLFNICLDIKGRRDPQLDAWDRLLNRIERCMLEFDRTESVVRRRLIAGFPPADEIAGAEDITKRLLA